MVLELPTKLGFVVSGVIDSHGWRAFGGLLVGSCYWPPHWEPLQCPATRGNYLSFLRSLFSGKAGEVWEKNIKSWVCQGTWWALSNEWMPWNWATLLGTWRQGNGGLICRDLIIRNRMAQQISLDWECVSHNKDFVTYLQ